MSRKIIVTAATAMFLSVIGVPEANAQAPKLVRSLAGPSGKTIGTQFVLDETRNRFVYPQDRSLTVYFEWEFLPGDHVLTATWKQPDGRVASVSPDVKIQSPSAQLSCYWIFEIAASNAAGTWTVDIRIDGHPAGSHAFELAGVDGTSTRFTLDQVSTTYGPAIVRVHKFDDTGRKIDTSSGFVVGPNAIATAFQSIDAAARLEIEFADSRRVPVDAVVALSRLDDWAVVKADTQNTAPIPLGNSSSIPVGSRLAAFSFANSSRVVVPVSVGAIAAPPGYGPRIRFAPDVSRDALGGPLIDERGKVVGILGGSVTPGSRFGEKMMSEFPALYRVHTDGNSATAIPDLTAAAGGNPRQIADLLAAGLLTAPITPMVELGASGTTTQLPKDPADRSIRDMSEFSIRDDGQVTVYGYWLKRGKTSKGELSATLSSVANEVRAVTPVKKVSLGSQELRVFFSWPLKALPPGYYRLDVLWDGKPVWRTYVRVVE